jgi:UDP-N-acetylmuramoyl-L-alanyl-D-glutamate--2,6-diaminopimelate ligase
MIGYLTANHPLIDTFRLPAAATTRVPDRRVKPVRAAPKLAAWLSDVTILSSRGALDRPVAGLFCDSRGVLPGGVFFALPGARTDGARHVDEAVRRGAVAVVGRGKASHLPLGVTYVEVADPRAALAAAAQRCFGFPDRAVGVVGVAGEGGKTTIAHLVQHLLGGASGKVGLLGTNRYDLGLRSVPAPRTTPESLEVFGLLAQMREAGCQRAVVELSAAGLARGRVRGLRLAAAVLTGDSDGTLLDQVLAASGAWPAVTVVNLDFAGGAALAERLAGSDAATRVVLCGEHPAAQIRAEAILVDRMGSTFRLVWPGGVRVVRSPLLGRGNVQNLVAAVAVAWGIGLDPAQLALETAEIPLIAGRMERIETRAGFEVVVDFAHTAAALRHALATLREVTPGRVIVAFGCGGQRDRTRRAPMMAAAQAGADFVIATTDNPRGELPEQIFADMAAGVTAPERVAWIADRRRAISLALAMARPGDCVLVAGKGHEAFQELDGVVVPFDDRRVVAECLEARRAMTARV